MELAGKDISLAGILTNPDSKRGRRSQSEPTDVSAAAFELDILRKEKGLAAIPQLKPEKLDALAREETSRLGADLLVSFAYGKFFGPRFLALFPRGGINIHPSLLPKYRGACPIPALILGREKESGICIQCLSPELDCGNILAMDRFLLCGRETTLSLSETVAYRAAQLLKDLLLDFDSKLCCACSQNGEATHCREMKKEAGLINWNNSAVSIDAQIRAFTPWPLSFSCCGKEMLFILEAEVLETEKLAGKTEKPNGESVCSRPQSESLTQSESLPAPGTVLGTDKTHGILIQTGDGILAVKKLQWQAKKALDWKAFCNGARDFVGSRLG